MGNNVKQGLLGTRIQGTRHIQRRSVVPVKRPCIASVCVRAGNPEYPVTNTYEGRKDRKEGTALRSIFDHESAEAGEFVNDEDIDWDNIGI